MIEASEVPTEHAPSVVRRKPSTGQQEHSRRTTTTRRHPNTPVQKPAAGPAMTRVGTQEREEEKGSWTARRLAFSIAKGELVHCGKWGECPHARRAILMPDCAAIRSNKCVGAAT